MLLSRCFGLAVRPILNIQVQMLLKGVHQFLHFIYERLGSIKMIYEWDFKSILLISVLLKHYYTLQSPT